MAWSAAVTTVEPAEEPITLDQVKEFVSIDATEAEFDTLLGGFIAAARGHLQAITGTRLVVQTVELQADSWSDLLCLPIGPVSDVVSVKYDDVDGVEQTIADTVYELTGAGLARGIRTKVGEGWPNSVRSVSGAIRVALTVGYDTLPPELETALLLMVSDQFAFRESGVVGMAAATIKSSMQLDGLIMNHRIWL
ncbi:hypothetical protein [Qipengyuania sp.]|uniref:head-tail connector protein n=1 Tax=Qipengyuania sp. TaxID=2004515 RepID=UPI00351426F3